MPRLCQVDQHLQLRKPNLDRLASATIPMLIGHGLLQPHPDQKASFIPYPLALPISVHVFTVVWSSFLAVSSIETVMKALLNPSVERELFYSWAKWAESHNGTR